MKSYVVRIIAVAGFLAATGALAGLPTNGLPTNGLPTNGLPTNGVALSAGTNLIGVILAE